MGYRGEDLATGPDPLAVLRRKWMNYANNHPEEEKADEPSLNSKQL